MVYIGLPTNPQFLGPQDPGDIARVIVSSRGPSGENAEYLFMLESALEGLGESSGDEHVKDLAVRVRNLQTQARQQSDSLGESDRAFENNFVRSISGGQGSHGLNEETEK